MRSYAERAPKRKTKKIARLITCRLDRRAAGVLVGLSDTTALARLVAALLMTRAIVYLQARALREPESDCATSAHPNA